MTSRKMSGSPTTRVGARPCFRNAFNKFVDSDSATTEQLTVDLLDNRIRNQRSSAPFFIVNFFATLSKSPAPFEDVQSSP
ncbi:hypothetical protein MTO96_023486 [Rhipicephalus appendiculatus]